MLAYADDTIVTAETKEKRINALRKLIRANKEMGLHKIDGETNFLIVSKIPPNADSIEVDNYTFEKFMISNT